MEGSRMQAACTVLPSILIPLHPCGGAPSPPSLPHSKPLPPHLPRSLPPSLPPTSLPPSLPALPFPPSAHLGGADGAGAHAHTQAIRARLDQAPRLGARHHIAGNDVQAGVRSLDVLNHLHLRASVCKCVFSCVYEGPEEGGAFHSDPLVCPTPIGRPQQNSGVRGDAPVPLPTQTAMG